MIPIPYTSVCICIAYSDSIWWAYTTNLCQETEGAEIRAWSSLPNIKASLDINEIIQVNPWALLNLLSVFSVNHGEASSLGPAYFRISPLWAPVSVAPTSRVEVFMACCLAGCAGAGDDGAGFSLLKHLGVSITGTPKMDSLFHGKPHESQWLGGPPISGNLHLKVAVVWCCYAYMLLLRCAHSCFLLFHPQGR